MGCMRNTLHRAVASLALVAVTVSIPSAVGFAQNVTAPPIGGTTVSPQRTTPLVDLQIQESIDRRQAYQQLQQLRREQDRNATRYRPERLDVPVMKRSCTTSVYGSSLSSGCR